MAVCTLRCIALVLVGVFFRVDLSTSACPPADQDDGTMGTYVAINETLYDRTYSRMDSGRHPLGFYTATWTYNQGDPSPCIKISAPNARDSRLEIKVETVPPSRLCVKDQNSAAQCFEGTYANCRETPADTVFVEFLCDSQCGEADVSFWYRLVLSPPQAVDWCLHRDNLFPADLAMLPSGATLPTYPIPSHDDGTGAAPPPPSSSSSSLALLLAAAAAVLVMAADAL